MLQLNISHALLMDNIHNNILGRLLEKGTRSVFMHLILNALGRVYILYVLSSHDRTK